MKRGILAFIIGGVTAWLLFPVIGGWAFVICALEGIVLGLIEIK